MKITLLLVCLGLFLWTMTGCEVPQPIPDPSQDAPFGNLKVSDLSDTTQNDIREEFLMSFRVLAYTIAPGAIDELDKACRLLSQQDVRLVNQDAFRANGLAVGAGSFEEGSEVARKLNEAGATRVAQMRLIVPPGESQILSRTLLQGTETFAFIKSPLSTTEITPAPGFIGWVFTAKPDPRLRGMAQIHLYPAFWQQGIENIRLMMGKQPIEFHPINEGGILTRMGEQGFMLLAPGRDVSEQLTLDKLLFFLPGRRPKVQFFVIIFDSMGTQ